MTTIIYSEFIDSWAEGLHKVLAYVLLNLDQLNIKQRQNEFEREVYWLNGWTRNGTNR